MSWIFTVLCFTVLSIMLGAVVGLVWMCWYFTRRNR